MNKVYDVLNKQVANWSVLYFKLHNFHWFVKGPKFFELHEAFEGLYNEASTHIDALAEQVLIKGGRPIATLKEMLAIASVDEANGKETAEEMVVAIKEDFLNLIEELKVGFAVVSEAKDETTAGLLLDIQNSLEKHVWMLNAYIN